MMVKSNHLLGKQGEDLAVSRLIGLKYTILHRNWRSGRYEIDIIATKENVVHCIEVKMRKTLTYGWPEQYITNKKIWQMRAAAECYLFANKQFDEAQLYILSIQVKKGKMDYQLMEIQ